MFGRRRSPTEHAQFRAIVPPAVVWNSTSRLQGESDGPGDRERGHRTSDNVPASPAILRPPRKIKRFALPLTQRCHRNVRTSAARNAGWPATTDDRRDFWRHGTYSTDLMNLTDYQTRLEVRFAETARNRSAHGRGHSIFALEHGLGDVELSRMQLLLRDRISKLGSLDREYWLPWITYAAEVGYSYSGNEYWHTFADETPGWDNRHRHRIRDWYERFAREYRGVRPSGDWAAHFSIIAWPINHAIIPQDLQRFLARVLFEARHDIVLLLDDHARLGQRIASWAHATSDRFRQFVAQHELVGQIAAALLAGEEDASSLLSKDTLHRLRTDLEKEISSRNWMNAARESVNQFRRFGLKAPSAGSPSFCPQAQSAGMELRHRAKLEPKLVLEPRGAHTWAVLLETPDLTGLFEENPTYRDRLSSVRCKITGAKDGFFALGFLCVSRRVPLQSLPTPSQALVRFERHDLDIERIFDTEFVLRPLPARLFRISADNIGVEVKTQIVRTGGRYVLLTVPDQRPESPLFSTAAVECSGVVASEFVVSDASVALGMEPILRKLSISVDRWLSVQPVGLPPKSWDGQGAGRWLTTDEPIIEVSSSLPIDEFKLALADGMPTVVGVPKTTTDQRVFIQLPTLPRGDHVLTIGGRQSGEKEFRRLGRLDIGVDDPTVWVPGTARGVLEAVVAPANADLDEFWTGRATLQVSGPASHAITPIIEFLDGRDQVLGVALSLPSLRLPIEPAAWLAHFLSHAQSHAAVERYYDAAASARLTLKTADLGEVALHFERRLTRLRWRVVGNNGVVRVQLIDHHGGVPPRVAFMPCATPTLRNALENHQSDDPFECTAPGLLVATVNGDRDSLVVAPIPKADMQLSDIRGANPTVETPMREVTMLADFLNVIEAWSSARLPGSSFAAIRRNVVLQELHRALFGALCGAPWQKAEVEADSIGSRLPATMGSPDDLSQSFFRRLGRDLDRTSESRRLIDGLLRDAPDFIDQDTHERLDHLVPYLRPLLPSLDVPLVAEFALRLASTPEAVSAWAGPRLMSLLSLMLGRRWLIKACRFMTLVVHREAVVRGEDPPLRRVPIYGGWEWS